MAASTFDELEALGKLTDAGMPSEHAYAIAGELRKVGAIRRTGTPDGRRRAMFDRRPDRDGGARRVVGLRRRSALCRDGRMNEGEMEAVGEEAAVCSGPSRSTGTHMP